MSTSVDFNDVYTEDREAARCVIESGAVTLRPVVEMERWFQDEEKYSVPNIRLFRANTRADIRVATCVMIIMVRGAFSVSQPEIASPYPRSVTEAGVLRQPGYNGSE